MALPEGCTKCLALDWKDAARVHAGTNAVKVAKSHTVYIYIYSNINTYFLKFLHSVTAECLIFGVIVFQKSMLDNSLVGLRWDENKNVVWDFAAFTLWQ